jgi:hypothetical protein
MYGDGTGTGGKVLGGLGLIVPANPAVGSPGGINRATFTFWRSQQTLGTQTAAPFDNLLSAMRKLYNNCSNGVSGMHPTFSVTTQIVFEGFEAKLTLNDRYIRESKSDKGITGYKSDSLMFKDIPIAYDVACPAGLLYMLNTTNLKLAYQSGYWMKGFPAVDPANQTVDIFKVMTICNLYSNNPRRLGVVTVIT